MKKFSLVITGVFLFLGIGSAHANVVDFSGANVDMGTVAPGQSGTISNNTAYSAIGPFNFGTGSTYGFLPADSAITFTYTYTGQIYGWLHGYGSYSYTSGGLVYSGNSSSYSYSPTVSSASVNGVASAPLVFASANQTADVTGGTVSIVNSSGGLAQIQSLFSILFAPGGQVTSETYNVSSVPLPASFPMFATLIAGIAGFALYSRRRNA